MSSKLIEIKRNLETQSAKKTKVERRSPVPSYCWGRTFFMLLRLPVGSIRTSLYICVNLIPVRIMGPVLCMLS